MEPGTRLGHYEILGPLGGGGMGEVYRARDTTLDRDVAIKVLPEDFATDQERLARFEREAKLLAQLNHPNIAAIYGLERAEDARFLVLELVEGKTLADQLNAGPLAVEEALKVGQQIAEALEAAHEKGIVHRDLKPANVMLTPDGKVKVLDFGLAKAMEGGGASEAPTDSPTITAGYTRAGTIMGTAAYMSPEQAKGNVVDKRADVWALGCVLYESLVGVRPFQGNSVTETLAAVLEHEPDWERLPAATPPNIRILLERCLRKEADRRLRDIGDARIEIEEALGEPLKDRAKRNGSLDFKIRSVKRLPPPSRAPLLVGLVGGPLVFLANIFFLYVGFDLGSADYRIRADEFLEPASVIAELRNKDNVFAAQIRSHLPIATRNAIDEFHPQAEPIEVPNLLRDEVRRELNELLLAHRLVLDAEAVDGLLLSEGLNQQIDNEPEGDELQLVNRRLLERVFDGWIEIYRPQDAARRFDTSVSDFWSFSPVLFLGSLLLFLAYSTYMAVLVFSLRTIRIIFEDVRDVESVLDYFVSEMGFKHPVRVGDTLIFKAKLRTFLIWNIYKLRARVDGNTTILTGPTIMVRRFEKRVLAHSAG